MNHIKKKLLAILIPALVFAAFPSHAASDKEKDWVVTAVHRSIASQDQWLNTSRPLTADDLKGRVILLDFWTYACINCIHIIPDLKELEKTYGDKIAVIGVHSGKFENERNKDNIRAAILRYGLEHPVVNDKDFYIWKKLGVKAWPTLMLISPEGRIDEVFQGEGNLRKIKSAIGDMLKSYGGLINTSKLPIELEKDKERGTMLKFPGKLVYVNDYKGSPALFVSDSGNNRILGMTPQGRIFVTIGSGEEGDKDGSLKTAEFHNPQGLIYKDSILYVADTNNHLIRKINLEAGTVETIAGTGKQGNNRNVVDLNAKEAALSSPWDLAFYPDDSHIAIAMAGLHQIWSYDIAAKTLKVIAGSGAEDIVDGAYPYNALAQTSGLSAAGSKLYFIDSETSSLRCLEDGQVKTLIGKGLFDFGYEVGDKDHALLQHPMGLAAADQNIFIADSFNHAIRRFLLANGKLYNFLGNGTRGSEIGSVRKARFNEPNGIAVAGQTMYIADTNNNAIKTVDLATNIVKEVSVFPGEAEEEVKYNENLPNLQLYVFEKVASGDDIKVSPYFKKGWHLNKDAPNQLAIFRIEGKEFKLLHTYNSEDFSANFIVLPPLEDGQSYKLQGTFYYCENKAGAQCYLKSVDKTIKAFDSVKKKQIYFQLF